MLDPEICDRCWKVKYNPIGNLPGKLPWMCASDFRLIVEHTDDPPRGCHKIFEQAIYNTLLKKS